MGEKEYKYYGPPSMEVYRVRELITALEAKVEALQKQVDKLRRKNMVIR